MISIATAEFEDGKLVHKIQIEEESPSNVLDKRYEILDKIGKAVCVFKDHSQIIRKNERYEKLENKT